MFWNPSSGKADKPNAGTPDFTTFPAHGRPARARRFTPRWSMIRKRRSPPCRSWGKASPIVSLLESIEGGDVRGRYSIIGREPDLIWRCDRGGKVFINRHALSAPNAFESVARAPLDDLRALLAECRIDAPDQPQPMAAGVFGYLGYENGPPIWKIFPI